MTDERKALIVGTFDQPGGHPYLTRPATYDDVAVWLSNESLTEHVAITEIVTRLMTALGKILEAGG